MASKVITTELTLPWFQVNALAFIPEASDEVPLKKEWAIFTHGYTSHKGDCLNWATRLVEAGVPCMIYDQPGHYLGSFHDLDSWESFKDHSHELFVSARDRLEALMDQDFGPGNYPSCKTVILGGHSLGGFQAIRALELPQFEHLDKLAIGIGVGLGQSQATHLFETAFYERTLSIRRQLVSPILDSKVVFAWLKEEKMSITVSNKRIHLITGLDDIVVTQNGLKAFVETLTANSNSVTFEEPKKLAHHEPGAATAHLYAFLKNQYAWK